MASALQITFILPILWLCIVTTITTSCTETDRRLFVSKNLLDNKTLLAFYNSNGRLKYSNTTSHIKPYDWSSWVDLGTPQGQSILSNPVGLHTSKSLIQIFIQASDGQVYTIQQLHETKTISLGKWTKVSTSKLDFQSGVVLNGLDSISIGMYKKQVVVFARTVSNKSALFWCRGNDDKFSSWERIGDTQPHLITDATVIFNTFSGYYEAFAVMNDGCVYRTWQRNDKIWAGWRSMGIGQPSVATKSRPVAIVMSHSFFNGVLQVFFLGADGVIKQIYQTTCDGVDNPWGYCTWGLWSDLSGEVPPSMGANVISAGSNIHLGGEVFTVDTKGVLWHSWQLERGDGWSKWQEVTTSQTSKTIITKPFVSRDDKMWWKVYALGKDGNVIVVEQSRSLNVKPSRVASGTNLTASWSVPVDEATNMDWIGIYPAGTNNDQYVDFIYVQGSQNPKASSIPKGSVNMKSFLPDGKYDVRYLVNRQFVNVIDTTVEYYNGSHDEEWVQVYRGIFEGMGAKSTNFKECVEDGNKTIATFRQSFEAFQNKEVLKGLQIMGDALNDVKKTLIVCLQTDIAKAMEKFIKDLISCTAGNCVNFIIDNIDILLIFYEDFYEIFGDIRAASNSFDFIGAYEQGGLCIGRVVKACISLPMKITPNGTYVNN